jgi:hypothetical protein
MFFFAPLLLGSHLLAVADSVPVFDIKKSCEGRNVAAVFGPRNSDTCIKSEEAARDQLKKSWGEFAAKDKMGCVATAKIGGTPSYIEVLTCLEIIRDLDKMRATSSDKPEEGGTTRSRRKRR